MDPVRQLVSHFVLDFAAVSVLTFAVYYPRHRRRDLIPGYLALNVSVFVLAAALGRSGDKGGIALGFGLIGVLSIVGIRAESLQSEEAAYYFTTLVLGLISGLPNVSFTVAAVLCALPLIVVYVAGHPRLFSRTERAVVTVDEAVTEPEAIENFVRARLGEPLSWKIQEVDYVRDLTIVDLRYRRAAAIKGLHSRRMRAVGSPRRPWEPRVKPWGRGGGGKPHTSVTTGDGEQY